MTVERAESGRCREPEQQLRFAIEQLADQLCVAVDGEFDFKVNAESCDETTEKLQMLINFVLDTARRSLGELDERIEELEQTATALRRERYVLDPLIDQMPNSVYFKDRESRFTRINAALARRIQLTDPQQAIGKTDFDFFSAEHARAAREEEEEIIRSGRPVVNNEEQEVRRDGRIAWMLTTKMPLHDAAGKIVGTFGISRNITEHKREEGRVRAIVESSPDGLLFVDADGVIVITNSATERMFGYAREELVGQTVEVLVPEGVRHTHTERRRTFVREHGSRTVGAHFDFHGRRKNGIEFPVEVGLCPVSLPEGDFIITTIHDITERKHLQREFRAAREIQRSLLP
ncbi:MAG: hypothetical protein CMJ48_11570, partial [Planctomycetaceae bacterium]|nr:hypothetical protein [Planctomycetaceae bacterium]